jgi:radical SAM protein with 4Fe4S-binding SPASM domain
LTEDEYNFFMSNEFIEKESERYNSIINSFLYIPSPNGVYIEPQSSDEYKINRIEENKLNFDTLSLIITPLCNLRCKYCFTFGGEQEKIVESRTINHLYNSLDLDAVFNVVEQIKPKSIHFFGWGEPTLAFEKIKDVVETLGNKIKYRIVTNGVYFKRREEIVKFLMENNFHVQISFDGLPRVNDNYRVLPDGSPSSPEILATFKEFQKYKGYENHVSISDIICGGYEDTILESTKYLESIGFKKLIFEPLEMNGRALVNKVEPVDVVKMALNVVDAVIYGKEHGLQIISKLLPAANDLTGLSYGCSFVSGESIALGPDYSFYSCEDGLPEFRVGSLNKDGKSYNIEINYEKLNNLIRSRYAFNLENCENCPVQCGGGCAKCSFTNYNNFRYGGESEEYCDARRQALAKYIRLAFDKDK